MIPGWRLRLIQIFTLLATVIVFPAILWAQEYDDDEEGPTVPTASLSVRYDQNGQADVAFFSDQDVKDWAPLQASLEHSLNCSAGALTHPATAKPSRKAFDKLTPKQQNDLQTLLAQMSSRQLRGTCSGAMARNQFILSADLQFKDVVAGVQRIGEQQLSVQLSFPAVKYFEHTPGMSQYAAAGLSHVTYLFKVDSGDSAPVHLAFGYQKRDVYRALAIPVIFLLLPLLLVLWMRRAAIRGAKEDATAAWFSYFRVLNWCTLATMLFWIVGHSLRQGLEDLAAYQFPHDSAAAIGIRIAILMAPPWILYLLCLLSSYRVYVQVRGLTWSRREFYAAQILQVAMQAIPVMCVIAAMELITVSPRWSMVLLASIYFLFMVGARLRMKVTSTHPEALTTGELRDRVFDLAKRAGTELRQVFVMPAGKSQMANAFASGNKLVIFTDYLLARLNKREVTAIAAHEITHLQKHHIKWKAAGIIALILSPSILRTFLSVVVGLLMVLAAFLPKGSMATFASGLQRIETFPELDLIFFLIGLALFYLQSRILENAADAGAVRLTGDPEALMTGLLKLGRLNLMPVQWGRVSGTLLTHPSTMKRVQRIAKIGQVPAERVQQIVAQYQAGAAGPAENANLPATEETFAEAVAPGNRVVTTARATQSAMNKLWVLLFFHIAPAASVAYAVGRLQLQGKALTAAYVGGALLCVAAYALVIQWMSVWGRQKLQQQFAAKMQSHGVTLANERAMLVGFSPDATVRFYVSTYNWDNGYLFCTRDRLCYMGDHTSFTLRPDQIRDIRLGKGVPAWFLVQRVYFDWWDETGGTLRTCNIVPMRPCSFWNLQKETVHLHAWLREWMMNPSRYPQATPPLAVLKAPGFGEVTSRSIKSMHAFGRALGLAFWIVLLAIAVCTALRLPATLYVSGVVLLLRLYEHWPMWRSKEQAKPAPATLARAAGASN